MNESAQEQVPEDNAPPVTVLLVTVADAEGVVLWSERIEDVDDAREAITTAADFIRGGIL